MTNFIMALIWIMAADDQREQILGKVVKGKDGTPKRNIVLHVPGPKGAAKNIESTLEAWNFFFNADVIDRYSRA